MTEHGIWMDHCELHKAGSPSSDRGHCELQSYGKRLVRHLPVKVIVSCSLMGYGWSRSLQAAVLDLIRVL